jgi:hypothetical protein
MILNLDVYRVVYGKKDTPLPDREYQIPGNRTVGNIKELIKFFGSTYNQITYWSNAVKGGSKKTLEQRWRKDKGGEWVVCN